MWWSLNAVLCLTCLFLLLICWLFIVVSCLYWDPLNMWIYQELSPLKDVFFKNEDCRLSRVILSLLAHICEMRVYSLKIKKKRKKEIYADQYHPSDPLSIKSHASMITWRWVNVSQNQDKQKLAGLFFRHISLHMHLWFKDHSALGFYFFKITNWKLTFF